MRAEIKNFRLTGFELKETFKTILAQKEKPLGGICRFAFAKGKRQNILKPRGIEALGRRRLRKD